MKRRALLVGPLNGTRATVSASLSAVNGGVWGQHGVWGRDDSFSMGFGTSHGPSTDWTGRSVVRRRPGETKGCWQVGTPLFWLHYARVFDGSLCANSLLGYHYADTALELRAVNASVVAPVTGDEDSWTYPRAVSRVVTDRSSFADEGKDVVDDSPRDRPAHRGFPERRTW